MSVEIPRAERTQPALRSWGRLLRLSLAPTAAADVLAGLLVAGGGELPSARSTLALVGASLCVYHANMALNDWCDRRADRGTRPDRPLTSGAVSPAAALAAVVLLGALGIALGFAASPGAGAWIAGIAALASLYNVRGRGPTVGPLLLATCRAANLAIGIAFLGFSGVALASACPPLLYGGYVFTVSRLGRLEDREDEDASGDRPRRMLIGAATILCAVALMPLPGATAASRLGALFVAAAGAAGLVARARTERAWTPALVGASMGLALRRLLVFTAATALLCGTATSLVIGLCILLGFPVSYALRHVFPPS